MIITSFVRHVILSELIAIDFGILKSGCFTLAMK